MPQSGPPRDLTTTTTVLDQGPAVVAPRLVAAERYVLLEQIGAGAMGVVYAAYDSQLDRKVALKLLPEHLLGGSYQDRLRREARALAQLSHPNVVPVYDVGETGGRVFFTMEFVRGQTAASWVAEPRSIDAVLAVGRAAAAGLAAAHAIGLVHRDVKPSNLLIGDDGRVRVADFGLAHVEQTTPPEGAAGEAATGFAGSPAYMAPEQLRAGPLDARCDQFALCVTLYELLNGRRPFTEATIDEQLAAIEAGPPPPVRSLPAWLTAAIARGLSTDPAARFADLSALGAALVPPRSRRPRWWIAAGGLALVAGAAGLVIATRGDVEPPPAAPSCEREAAAIDATWTPARRDALRERVSGGADDRARIAALLDDYATAWRQQREAVCHAARIEYTWSPELAVRATHCLEDRRGGFDRMLGALLAGRDPIDPSSALAAMTTLRTARTCGDPDYLRSTNEIGTGQGRRAAMPELEAAIEELELAHRLGRNAQVDRALPALRARLVGRGGAEARLLRLEGDIARARGDRDAAIRLHTTSYTVARAARHPTAAAMAAASLVWVHGLYGEELARASDWAEISKAEAASLGDHEVGVTVHYALGALADRRGDLPLALAEFQRAQAAAAREFGPDHYTTATVTVAIASTLGALGRFEEAIAPHRAAIETLARWESPRSRGVARALYNLALTESSAGRHADAERDASRSLELALEIGEPELQATALHNLGVVRIGAGKLAEAAPLFDQAIAQFEAIGLAAAAGSSRVHRAIATIPAAVASRSAAAIARVRADLVEGRDAITAAYGADDLAAIDAEVALADLFSQLGRCGEASPLLARAEAGYERARAPEVVRGKLRPPRERCAGSR